MINQKFFIKFNTVPFLGAFQPLSRMLLLSFLALGLSSCGGLIKLPESADAPSLYRLSAATQFRDLPEKVDWQLAIEEPTAPEALNNSRIALVREGREIRYLAGARWSDRVPRQVLGLLIKSFENSGSILSIGDAATIIRNDFTLFIDIRRFEVEISDGDSDARARMEIHARLMRHRDSEIIAARTFTEEKTATGQEVDALIDCLDEALSGVLAGLTSWTLSEGEATR